MQLDVPQKIVGMFVLFAALFFFIETGKTNNDHDKLIALKHKTSQVLRLQGVQFDGLIANIQFDGISWGNIDLNDEMIKTMDAILDSELYLIKRKTLDNHTNFHSKLSIPVSKFIVTRENEIIQFSVEGIKNEALKNMIRVIAKNLLFCNMLELNIIKEVQEIRLDKRFGIILVKQSNNNYSQLGMQSNHWSVIHLRETADYGTITNLLMTALGFTTPLWQQDRDEYVTVNWQNIQDQHKYLFHQWNVHLFGDPVNDKPRPPYDFNSALHYLPNEYAKDSKVVTWQKKTFQKRGWQQQMRQNNDSERKLATDEYCFPPKISPAIPPCEDTDVKCLSWKDQRVCQQAEIREKCPLACETCRNIYLTKCEDQNSFCPDWASAYCDIKSDNFKYMTDNCQKSCGCLSDAAKIVGPVDVAWKTIGDSNTICNKAVQQTFVPTENECKNWCSSKKLNYCFWDISENDNFCFGTRSCGADTKTVAVTYRRFEKPV